MTATGPSGRPKEDGLEGLQAGDGGTFLIIGKDVVLREYTVLLKDAEGRDAAVVKWPFDAMREARAPRRPLSAGQAWGPSRTEVAAWREARETGNLAWGSVDQREGSTGDSPASLGDGGAGSAGEWADEYERMHCSRWGDLDTLEEERRERLATQGMPPPTFGCTRFAPTTDVSMPGSPTGETGTQHTEGPCNRSMEHLRARDEDEDASDRQSMGRESFEEFLRGLGVEDPNAIEEHWKAMSQGGRVRPTEAKPKFAWEAVARANPAMTLRELLRGGQRVRPEETAGLEVCEGTQADEWDAPHCPLQVREGGLVRLREGPHRKSQKVSVDLPGGTPLRAVSWEIRHESIEVHVVRGAVGEALSPSRWAGGTECEVGWIALEDVMGYDDRRWYRGLTEDEWYNSCWQTTVEALRVWVSQGGRTWQQVYDSILPVQGQKREEKKHLAKVRETFEAEGYTYVALGLGRMWRGKWEVTNLRLHVTIAYAAAMAESEMKALQEILTHQVHEWGRLEPHLRPRRLTRFRQWETQTRVEKAGDTRLTRNSTRRPIVSMGQGEVEAMVAEDRIHTLDLDAEDEETLSEFVGRLYHRDRDRLQEGRERAAALSKNNGQLRVECADEGLGEGSQEIQDLLAYLADTVRFFASASKRLEPEPGRRKGKLVPPYVTPPERWHITKQGSWLRSTECSREEQDETE